MPSAHITPYTHSGSLCQSLAILEMQYEWFGHAVCQTALVTRCKRESTETVIPSVGRERRCFSRDWRREATQHSSMNYSVSVQKNHAFFEDSCIETKADALEVRKTRTEDSQSTALS